MIYVIGDSFTWGDEISDYIVPNFYGYLSPEDPCVMPSSDWSNNKQKYIDSMSAEEQTKHTQIRLDHRWTESLSKKLNVEVFNAGRCGISTQGIITQLVNDFSKFQNNKQDVDLIILQLTSPFRYQLPSPLHNTPFSNLGYTQINPAMNNSYYNLNSANVHRFLTSKLLIDTDQNVFYDFLYKILELQLIAQLYTGKKLVIVNSIFQTEIINLLHNVNKILDSCQDKKDKVSRYRELLTTVDLENEITKYTTMAEIVQSTENCYYMPMGHVCKETHEVFGTTLGEQIINQRLLN